MRKPRFFPYGNTRSRVSELEYSATTAIVSHHNSATAQRHARATARQHNSTTTPASCRPPGGCALSPPRRPPPMRLSGEHSSRNVVRVTRMSYVTSPRLSPLTSRPCSPCLRRGGAVRGLRPFRPHMVWRKNAICDPPFEVFSRRYLVSGIDHGAISFVFFGSFDRFFGMESGSGDRFCSVEIMRF